MKAALGLAAAIALSACATHPRQWVREGAGAEDFHRDSGQCKAEAFAVPGAPMLQIAMVYNACMQGKGWRQE